MRLINLAAIILILASCSNQSNKPDLSKIKVDLSVERFERDFFAIDTNSINQSLTKLNQKYPRFYPSFINDILLLNHEHSTGLNGQVEVNDTGALVIRSFYRGYESVYRSIQDKYKNLDWLKNDLEKAFRHVKYYYPSYTVPGVITFIGTFDAPGMIITPKYLGIGLQQFAGKDFGAYQDPVIQQIYPAYISRRFDKEYITANCMKAVVDDLYPDSSMSSSLIEQMIEKGKQWWLTSRFLPDAPDSAITGYTKRQLEWCRENEGNIWTSILTGSQDLYTIEPSTIQMYIGEAPSTIGMPEIAPGNIGQWIGWRIVEKFAQKNEKMKLQEVLATPAKKIFQEAKYKPK